MEKFCGSVGASFTLLYLVVGIIYHLSPVGAEIRPNSLACASLVCFALGLAAWRDIFRLFASLRVRQALRGFLLLLVWTFLILVMIRNYSGANWYGDWLEHFQRSLFFLYHFPTDTPILFGYQLPARPPAMNELAAFFLGQSRDCFEVFQAVFAFLNLLMFLPCCLILPALVGPRRTSLRPLIALFALNPVVMQNVTYTWTKAFTAFYVILGVCFYLAGLRKNDPLRIVVAFVALSTGLLVHYSAAPYLLFVTLHYLLCVFSKRPRRWLELATIASVCGLLLATWFGWSTRVYGARTTFASNTSVTLSQRYPGGNLSKMAANLVDSIVPVVVRDHFLLDDFNDQRLAGIIRDDVFVFYQMNVVFSMGLVGGPLILWLLYRALRRHSRTGSEASFWLALIPFCVVVGISSAGERAPLGVAHLTLLPLEILGLSLLAATFPLRRTLLVLLIAGCLIDFSSGILLHVYLESLENSSHGTIFAGLGPTGGQQTLSIPIAGSLSGAAWNNWFLKHQYALNTAGLDQLSRTGGVYSAVGLTQMRARLREDDIYWHGWYARNNGAIGFLGDHAAGASGRPPIVVECLLLVFMCVFVRLLCANRPSDLSLRLSRYATEYLT